MDEKPKRHWWQFRLWTLLVLVAGAAILAAQGAPRRTEVTTSVDALSDTVLHASTTVETVWNGRFLSVAGIEVAALATWIILRLASRR